MSMSHILNIQDKILFFGLPKSGLVSIDSFCHVNKLKINKIIYEKPANITYFRKLFPNHIFFIIVRNPWHRMVSMYFYWIHNDKNLNHFKLFMNLDNIPSFTDFIKLISNVKANGWGLSTQFNILDAKAHDFDIIIKIEEIDEQFKQIQNILKVEKPLEQQNKGNYSGSYRDYYTDETRDLVAKYFKYEIDTFGYTF
jgi:hypothetical protein